MTNQKGMSLIVVILTILVVILVSAYFITIQQKQSLIISEQQLNATPSPLQTSDSELLTWKMYTNSLYKYSFMYPPSHQAFDSRDYRELSTTGDEEDIQFLDKTIFKPEDSNAESNHYNYIQILVGQKECNYNIFDNVENFKQSKKESLEIDGRQAVKWTDVGPGYGPYADVMILVNNRSHCFVFYYLRNPSQLEESINLFNKMVSTFKFLD